MSERPAGGTPENDIYSVLVIVATVIVAAATIYMAVRSQQLFDIWHPFAATLG